MREIISPFTAIKLTKEQIAHMPALEVFVYQRRQFAKLPFPGLVLHAEQLQRQQAYERRMAPKEEDIRQTEKERQREQSEKATVDVHKRQKEE